MELVYSRFERIIRKFIPSTVLIGRNPLAKLLDPVDDAIKLFHPEWRSLPPASLRMRIGVGNQLLFNHAKYIERGNNIVQELHEKGCLKSDSRILELGCGCGRIAWALKRYIDGGAEYVGQDVDSEMIEWCQKNFQGPSYRFHRADIFNSLYNPRGKPISKYRIPVEDGSRDLVIAISLFTHLLYEDFLFYLAESSRVLKRGGSLFFTAFVLDFFRSRLGNRWTFAHKGEHCYYENENYPEAAVAYELKLIKEMLEKNQLTIREMYDLHMYTIIAEKQ